MSEAERITPYLPRLVSRWLRAAPTDQAVELGASVVFVDVSGFTRLSERLARLGRLGAEELAEAIGRCFGRMLADAYRQGGSLLKFGGDALLLLFSGPEHEVRACRASADMRATLRTIGEIATPTGTVTLRMSVGVHSGAFDLFLVGTSHRELVLAGPAFSRVVALEEAATAGQILISETTGAALGDRSLVRPHPDGWLLRRAPAGGATAAPHVVPEAGGLVVQGLPVALRDHVLHGGSAHEHRRVTVAFLRFGGTDDLVRERGLRPTAEALHELVTQVQVAADRYGVTLLGSDVDHDGGKLILVAGTPVAHGDDEERMLLAVHDTVAQERALALRIGVNSGHVFAGDVGPPYRRTYTIMGDAVNLAARLMAAAAPGEILTTDGVLARSRTAFTTTALPPFPVKGKKRPVQAHRLGAPTGSTQTATDLPFVGRTAELARLRGWVEDAARGSGVVIGLSAEPGMGKTRLCAELRADAPVRRALHIACERHEGTTPYATARRLLAAALSVGGPADAHGLRDLARRSAPDVDPWLPLVAWVLGLSLPATPETAQLEPQFLRPRLHRAVEQLLAAVLDEPTLIILDDAHWMDEASAELIGHLARSIATRPWTICAARHGDDAGGFVPAPPAPVRQLRLTGLNAEAAEALVHAVAADQPLASPIARTVVERGAGNPLYVAELAAGALRAGSADALPDSLESLLVARVDHLPPEDRAVLRRLAVLGQRFERGLAEELLGTDAAALTRLDELLETDGQLVAFRHGLVWESAYEALPFRLRRQLHRQVVAALERRAGDDVDTYAEALSFQCRQAQLHAAAWGYSRTAAARAAALYANAAAESLYERAIASGRALDALPGEALAEAYEALGDVRERMAAFAPAGEAYLAARRLVTDSPCDEARLLLKFARQQGKLSQLSQALRWTTVGLRRLDGHDDASAIAQRAQLLVWYAHFCQEQGRDRSAIAWCERAIAAAEAAGERDALAHAYRILDRAYLYLGRPDRAVHTPKALALYEELGDLGEQAKMLNNMGAFAYWQGRWSAALELYRRAEELCVRTGDEDGVAFAKANIAEVLSDQGRLDEAQRLFAEAQRIWAAAGHRSHAALVKSDLARVAARAGRHAEAARLFAEARAESDVVGARADVLETDLRLAELHVLQGNPAAGLSMVERHLADWRLDIGASHPGLRRVQGYARLQLGDLAGARTSLQASLDDARGREATYEVALTLRALADLADRDGLDDPASLRASSDELLARLDVVLLPDIPLPDVGRREIRLPSTATST